MISHQTRVHSYNFIKLNYEQEGQEVVGIKPNNFIVTSPSTTPLGSDLSLSEESLSYNNQRTLT